MKEHDSEEMLLRRGPQPPFTATPCRLLAPPDPVVPQRGVSPTTCGLGARTQPNELSIRCRSRPANVEPKAIGWLHTVKYRTKCSGRHMWKLTNL